MTQAHRGSGLPGIYQDTTPIERFRERRRRIAEHVGEGGRALIQGAGQPAGIALFRQSNEMYYLTGIEVPHALLMIDGATAESTLYLPHHNPDAERGQGPLLNADDPDQVSSATGIERIRPLESMPADLARHVLVTTAPALSTPLSPPELGAQSRDDLLAATAAALADPWSCPTTPQSRLVQRIASAFPGLAITDLSPILDGMRLIKDDDEVALLRRAGELTAAGVTAAMRSTVPGCYEFQLAATAAYAFGVGGARGDGYRGIVATGANAWFGHYGRQSSRLVDGDLILMDYAPDFAYYTSDIGRMWPVNGTFSDSQRTLYTFITTYHRALLARIRAGRRPDDIMDEAAAEMSAVLDRTRFASRAHEHAARGALDFRGHLSHPVGMSVHDVGRYRDRPLVPGIVISIDPMMWIEPESLYVRCEDTIVITADGCEVLTGDAPLECDEIEATMREPGILQQLPIDITGLAGESGR